MNMKKGFTLIEMMVAVSIIAIAVTGPLMAASRAYFSAQNAQEQVVASYLSQEAIEFARAVRDYDFLNQYQSGGTTDPWGTFLNNALVCSGATACSYDPGGTAEDGFQPCRGGTTGKECTPLYLANSGGVKLYTLHSEYLGAAATPFTRSVQFYAAAPAGATLTNATEVRVTATTTWQSHGQTFTAAVSDTLTPWQ